jgi:Predicted membrane protein
MKTDTKQIAYTALLLSLSLIIGVIEHMLPPIVPAVPFLRLGLSNVVVLYTLVVLGFYPALTITILKSVLVPLFAGNPAMIMYSLPSTLLAFLLMAALVKFFKSGMIAVSASASVVHNFVQLSVAAIVTESAAVFSFAFYLLPLAVAAGAATGLIAYFGIKYIPVK